MLHSKLYCLLFQPHDQEQGARATDSAVHHRVHRELSAHADRDDVQHLGVHRHHHRHHAGLLPAGLAQGVQPHGQQELRRLVSQQDGQ